MPPSDSDDNVGPKEARRASRRPPINDPPEILPEDGWGVFWRRIFPLALLLILATIGFVITALGIAARHY